MAQFEIVVKFTVTASDQTAANHIADEIDLGILCHPDFMGCLEQIEIESVEEITGDEE